MEEAGVCYLQPSFTEEKGTKHRPGPGHRDSKDFGDIC